MKLFLRIFFAYVLVVGVSSYYFIGIIADQIKAGTRQSTEEVLVDTANLLAELVEQDFTARAEGQAPDFANFAQSMDDFLLRSMSASIFSIVKSSAGMRVYITDDKGIVQYHSNPSRFGHLVGQDYSRWNDVYLTLRGEYGARSTKDDPIREATTVMYVAAPIKYQGEIVGVLSVGKPGVSVQPFIDRAIAAVKRQGVMVVLLSLLMAAILSFWLTRSVRQLTAYAGSVSRGEKATLPKLADSELQALGDAMEHMRTELDGKAYVENYVHTLTHELKSPIAAISGAAELISQNMPVEDFERFVSNIDRESTRLTDLVERMLALVNVENQQRLEHTERCDIAVMAQALVAGKKSQCLQKQIDIAYGDCDSVELDADGFLLRQALDNLLQNAIDFTPPQGNIVLSWDTVDAAIHIRVVDSGPGIPDFAKDKIFDRFYSLERPDTREKSSGIGLSFVREVAELHHGRIVLSDRTDATGTVAELVLPRKQYP